MLTLWHSILNLILGWCYQLRKCLVDVNTLYSRTDLLLIFEHYLRLKLFSDALEECNNAYDEGQVPNMTTKFWGTWIAYDKKHVRRRRMFTNGIFCDIEEILTRSLRTSLRRLSQQTRLSPKSDHWATKPLYSNIFGFHITLRGLWPHRSPDLSSPYFILWRSGTERVYSNNPRSLEELKEAFVRNGPQQLNATSHKRTETDECFSSWR